jgi:hypothetical protein
MSHDCHQQEKFLELAHFTGKIEQCVLDLRSDIDGLGANIRNLSKCITNTKLDVTKIQAKFGVVGLLIGVVGSTVVQVVIKEYFSK